MTTQHRIPQVERIGERETRQMRAEVLLETAAFERVSRKPEVWLIETPYGSVHECELDRGRCDKGCKDFQIHGHLEGFECKHIISCRMHSERMKKTVRVLAGFFGGEAA